MTELPPPQKVGVAPGLHPLLADRFSPRSFSDDAVDDAALERLLEAARWAPSSSNTQPWRFVVARPGAKAHTALVATMKGANAAWAPHAPVLLLTLARTTRDDGRPLRYAEYDLGQAVAHLTFQATADGLAVHQMAGFDADAAYAAVGAPDGLRPMTLVAVGRRGDPSQLTEGLAAREVAPRERLARADLLVDPAG